jgi:hypothetical protein
MPEAFVVGSTDRQNKAGEDKISSFSNVGQNIPSVILTIIKNDKAISTKYFFKFLTLPAMESEREGW